MTDVLINGDGAAGLAAAIILRKKGKTVTVVQRDANAHNTRVGESLTSTALISIKELGLINDFLLSGHPFCYGNSSCWGNDKLSYFDFIQSPMGSGWYIDRPMFDHMLRARAAELGTDFVTCGRIVDLERNSGDTWLYSTGNKAVPEIEPRIIIDASGRHSWLSRRLGIPRISDDKQIAVTTVLTTGRRIKSFHSMVEAVSDGWWYVADFTDSKTACIFFTDLGLHKLADLTDIDYLEAKKEQTLFVKHRVPGHAYEILTPPDITSAGSSSLAEYGGPGWLVAGDAACAMDPLSSHGIAFALRSGIDAALAAASNLDGSQSAICSYNETLHTAVNIYREQRLRIYAQETRWPESPYWKRRQGIVVEK